MAKVYPAQTPAHDTGAHGNADAAHGEHGSTKLYWLIGLILAIVTAIEVVWPSIGLGHVGLVAGLIALMVLKGAMVIMWFMHLKGDFNVFKFVFLAPFLIAFLFVLAFLGLFAGTHPGVAG